MTILKRLSQPLRKGCRDLATSLWRECHNALMGQTTNRRHPGSTVRLGGSEGRRSRPMAWGGNLPKNANTCCTALPQLRPSAVLLIGATCLGSGMALAAARQALVQLAPPLNPARA